MNRLDFSGRSAVITGGAAGIGLAIARRLVESGGRVSLWDRDAGAVEHARAALGSAAIAQVVDVTEQAEWRGRVRAALGSIPAEQRRVLELMYFDGKSQTRIASDLDLPLGTVKSRTLLGMRRLRTLLSDREETS